MATPLPKHRAREYETIFVIHPDTPTEVVDQIANRLTDVISRLEGKLLKAENWGKRRLAYPVGKQMKGTYIYLKYLGYSDMVYEVERNIRMLEPVIKHLTVKLEEDVDPASRTVREEEISFVPQFEGEPEIEEDRDHRFHTAPVAEDTRGARRRRSEEEEAEGEPAGAPAEAADDSDDENEE